MKNKFAAQLYTLREPLQKDFFGVLREVKKMGWAGVQISGLWGQDPKEIAAVLKETGLGTAGYHVALTRLEEELDDVLAEAELFQTKDVICPGIPVEIRNVEGYEKLKRDLNEIAVKIKEKGFRLSYHNHAFEFETTMDSGQNALEYLLDPAGDNLILAEIDVYWVKKGGGDPLSFIDKYANRMPIIHLKDMTKDEEQTFAEVGTGSIDFIPILQWGERNGIEWYAVEQDVCPGDPMDSLEISLNNLNKMADSLK